MSALETVEAALAAIEARDGKLHAWKAVDAEFARRQARALDAGPRARPASRHPGRREGHLRYRGPADRVRQPDLQGASPGSGCGLRGRGARRRRGDPRQDRHHRVRHHGAGARPCIRSNPKHTPGGSSSGSAAAVAAGMVRFAYGTQTVGSIIRPAAYCGVVGYKPSFGMLSRSGMKMGAETLDTAGVIARNVEDAALLAGRERHATRLARDRVPGKPETRRLPLAELAPHVAGGRARRSRARPATGGEGRAPRRSARLPFDELDAAASTILVYEMARGLAHEVAHHRARISPMLLERVDAGATMPYEKYAKAIAYAADCRRRLRDQAGDVDAILTPSATGEAPLGLGSTGNTAMNRLWTLLHGPCVTVPAGDGPGGSAARRAAGRDPGQRCTDPGGGALGRACSRPSMARLHDDEIAHYRREGWVVPRFRLPPARVAAMVDALETLLRHNPGVRPEKLVSAHIEGDNGEGVRGSRAFLELARDPEIVELVSGVIGEDVILWGCHVFCKPAVEGYETPWHQDGHYWPIRPLANCTVWVALEPSTVENGCLRVIPRSHAERRLHEHLHEDRTDLTLNQRMRRHSTRRAARRHRARAGPDVAARRLHDPRRARQHLGASAAPAWRCATCRRPRCSSATCARPTARPACR